MTHHPNHNQSQLKSLSEQCNSKYGANVILIITMSHNSICYTNTGNLLDQNGAWQDRLRLHPAPLRRALGPLGRRPGEPALICIRTLCFNHLKSNINDINIEQRVSVTGPLGRRPGEPALICNVFCDLITTKSNMK